MCCKISFLPESQYEFIFLNTNFKNFCLLLLPYTIWHSPPPPPGPPLFLELMCRKIRNIKQGIQSRTRGCTGLTSRTIYFSTGQYRCIVSDLPLFFIFISYVCVCVCVCVCVIINIKVYHKTLPQFKTNYS